MTLASRARWAVATAAAAAVVSSLAAVTPTTASAAPSTGSSTAISGNDVSWPNCPKGMGIPSRRSPGEPMPSPQTHFMVIGLTNGPGFVANPCIASQVAFARQHHILTGIYAMTTFPTRRQVRAHGRAGPWHGTDTLTRIRNAGYAEARYNIGTARRVGLTARFVWVDVEDYPVAPWTSRPALNRAAVEGVLRGYADAGYRTGIYSIVSMWNRLTGNWRNHLPLWDSVGGTSKRMAVARCTARSFTAGPRLLSQWWINGGIDFDVTCPNSASAQFTRPA